VKVDLPRFEDTSSFGREEFRLIPPFSYQNNHQFEVKPTEIEKRKASGE
jgi:hypothetical protein